MKLQDMLQALLYLLMRDCILPGEIELKMKDLTDAISTNEIKEFIFSNKYLAEYAANIIERLYKLQNDINNDTDN